MLHAPQDTLIEAASGHDSETVMDARRDHDSTEARETYTHAACNMQHATRRTEQPTCTTQAYARGSQDRHIACVMLLDVSRLTHVRAPVCACRESGTRYVLVGASHASMRDIIHVCSPYAACVCICAGVARSLLARAAMMSRASLQQQEMAAITRQQQQHPEQQQVQQMRDAIGVGVLPDDEEDDEVSVEHTRITHAIASISRTSIPYTRTCARIAVV